MNPTSPAGAILYGIIGGVLAYVFVSLVGQAVRKIVLPWYHDLVYRGVRLDGRWKVTNLLGSGNQTAELQLTQQADRVTGTCTFVKQESDEGDAFYEQVRTCKLSGTVRDRFVELSFRHVDPARLGAGVFLLEVHGDGRTMGGQQTFYSVGSSGIVSNAVVVHRPEAFPVADPRQIPLLESPRETTETRKPVKRQRKRD